jgi:hypothetical protein
MSPIALLPEERRQLISLADPELALTLICTDSESPGLYLTPDQQVQLLRLAEGSERPCFAHCIASALAEGAVVPPARDAFYWVAIARRLATEAHRDQVRRDGEPFITHPAAVASLVSGGAAKAVAWLHDTLEDTSLSPSALLEEGLPENLVRAVVRLSHDKGGESYDSYLRRVAACELTRRVKLADIRHNLSTRPTEGQRSKYEYALPLLLNHEGVDHA